MPATFTDNFDDNAIDGAKWDVGSIADQNAGVTVQETGGQLVVTPMPATAGSNRNGLLSDAAFNFTRGYAIWKVDQAAAAGVGNASTRCGLYLDASNYLSFEIGGSVITFRRRLAGVNSDSVLAYNAAVHKYFMLQHCGTHANWWYSTNGAVWVWQRGPVVPGFAVIALKTFMDAGTVASVATPGTAIFNDVEIGTLDFPLPFEQIAAFEKKVDLRIDVGFPLNLVPVEANTFSVPMQRRYSGARITAAGTILRYRILADGTLDTFDVWLPAANASATSVIFNMKVNGVSVWAGPARPAIAAGQSHASKTDIGLEVEKGQLVEILVEQLPTAGVAGPIDTIANVVVG